VHDAPSNRRSKLRLYATALSNSRYLIDQRPNPTYYFDATKK